MLTLTRALQIAVTLAWVGPAVAAGLASIGLLWLLRIVVEIVRESKGGFR